MKKKIRLLIMLLAMFVTFGAASLLSAAAEEEAELSAVKKTGWQREGSYYTYYNNSGKMLTGWRTIKGNVYYFRNHAEDMAPKGSRVTGFYELGNNTYYFSNKGVLQTGWKTIKKKNYYFAPNGKAGQRGIMYTGFKIIGKGRYLFNEDGSATVGWGTYRKQKYFFSNSTKLGIRGRALTGWKKIGAYKYFFSTHGVMQKNRWISKKYYLDSNGHMLKNCVTPDGYIVNASGVKKKLAKGWIKQNGKYYYYTSGKKAIGWKVISGKKYYFDETGIQKRGWLKLGSDTYYMNNYMQTGWKTISGKKYYFAYDGKLAVNTTVDGMLVGADGAVIGKDPAADGVKILLIAGHGQGDVGATAVYGKTPYYEYKYTREFASLIYQKLTGSGLKVTMYDQNYDCYQVMRDWIKYEKVSGPVPNLKDYDYILEIHFNATAEASKDLKGDKQQKGVGMYVNSAKKDITLDKAIVQGIHNTGFKVWGAPTGIFKSATLFNAMNCQSAGVSYGLLETAFIDDKDDMTFYNNNKDKMAQGVADALKAHFN